MSRIKAIALRLIKIKEHIDGWCKIFQDTTVKDITKNSCSINGVLLHRSIVWKSVSIIKNSLYHTLAFSLRKKRELKDINERGLFAGFKNRIHGSTKKSSEIEIKFTKIEYNKDVKSMYKILEAR